MNRHWFIAVGVVLVILTALSALAAPTLGDSGAKTTLGNDIIGGSKFIYSVGGLSIGTGTTSTNALCFTGGCQTSPFLGTSQTVSAANVSAGVFGYPAASSAYSFPAALGVGTTTTTGLPANGLYVAGNVGIGTTSPGEILHAYKASGNTIIKAESDSGGAYLLLDKSGDTAGSAAIRFETAGVAKWAIGMDNVADDNFYIGDTNSFVNKFVTVQKTNGNVGIGTTDPSVAKLQIVAVGSGITQQQSAGDHFYSLGFSNHDAYFTYYTTAGMTFGYGETTGGIPTVNTLRLLNNGNVGIGTSTPAHKLTVSGTYYSPTVVKGNCTGAVTIDWNAGNTQHCVLTGNVTFTFSNGQDGGNYRLILKQDATGSRTVTWPASARWGAGGTPTLSTVVNTTDYVGFLYNGVDSKYDGIAFNAGF